ncbi:hypothetical protein MAE02_65430 [Microvirga aerophila]|uniref:Uncharacterized protein n=1 Tax=Microvirga aerophila TaxID=670291 RepID=A0A512C475_9HYPH|nr:hypothetical protein MAE02_65430 [Microvirga aerophila]
MERLLGTGAACLAGGLPSEEPGTTASGTGWKQAEWPLKWLYQTWLSSMGIPRPSQGRMQATWRDWLLGHYKFKSGKTLALP